MIARLRKFGLTVGGVLSVLAIVFHLRHRHHLPFWLSVTVGPALVLGAITAPRVLAPVERAWMTAARLLGWVNTQILLGAVFFLVLTPIALMQRLLGSDPLSRNPTARRRRDASYWHPAKTKEEAHTDSITRLKRPY